MDDLRRCLKCGRPIPIGAPECPGCEGETLGVTYRTETVFGFSLALLVVLFVVTGFAVRMYHAKEQALGQDWFSRGDGDMKTGQPEQAIIDYRTALIYDRKNDLFELSLAKALLAAHYPDEARAHLITLWERQPESGEVNLELGRLAAQSGDINQALRYYHNAIYGDWQLADAREQRRNARLELYQFLIRRGANSQAQAELTALAAELPPDPLLHVQVGRMFLVAGEFHQAESLFLEAVQFDRADADALAGAGEAEFKLADYHNAVIHLEHAARLRPLYKPVAGMLETARLILGIDPNAPTISTAERNSRIVRAFNEAEDRLQACAEEHGETFETSPPQTPMQSLFADATKIKPQLKERILSRDTDTASAAEAWTEKAENLATATCGPPTGLDLAIVLAWRKQGGNPK